VSAAGRRVFFRTLTAAVHGGVDRAALRAEGVRLDGLLDFSSNRAPLGAAPGVAAALTRVDVEAYPDPRAAELAGVLAAHHGVPAGQVVVGNGSTELIRLIAQLALGPGDVALSLAPSFGEYELGTRLAGAEFAEVRLVRGASGAASGAAGERASGAPAGFGVDEPGLRAALGRLRPRLCWLCSPNNPTGAALEPALVASLVGDHPGTLFVLDEAYRDLLAAPQWSAALLAAGNLVVLHSLTKAWGLAGLRLGYALLEEGQAAALRAAAPPWNVNACAQAAGLAALADLAHYERSVGLLREGRDRLSAVLGERGWPVEPSAAGFFLVDVGSAPAVRSALLGRGCLVRDCSSFGLPAHVRVSPRLAEQNERLLAAFAALAPPPRRSA
jgi:histidinol-phosphate/aromatic aminotransferase/cobyric acid decarboxylase-like protein